MSNNARMGACSLDEAHRNLLSAVVSRAIADIALSPRSNDAISAASWILDKESEIVPFSFVWVMDALGYPRKTYDRIYKRARIVVLEHYER